MHRDALRHDPRRRPRSTPTWFVDELSFAGRENLDPSHVARYDGKEDAGAAGEVALLEELGLTRESVVVELGAGTGQFTRRGRAASARASSPSTCRRSMLRAAARQARRPRA